MKTTNSLKHMYDAWMGMIDWLFPSTCVSCGAEADVICAECRDQIKPVGDEICQVCGVPIRSSTSLCDRCRGHRPNFSMVRSVAFYSGPIRDAIKHLKYNHGIAAGRVLADLLFEKVSTLNWQVDVVIPVPLSSQHQKERGYNQSAVMAFPLALQLQKEYLPSALVRVREHRSQVGLSAGERYRNVENSFKARKEVLLGRSVLLVDDIYTTGATMNACSKALRVAGAREIFGITLAKAFRIRNSLDSGI